MYTNNYKKQERRGKKNLETGQDKTSIGEVKDG